jgi:hypothetical protein
MIGNDCWTRSPGPSQLRFSLFYSGFQVSNVQFKLQGTPGRNLSFIFFTDYEREESSVLSLHGLTKKNLFVAELLLRKENKNKNKIRLPVGGVKPANEPLCCCRPSLSERGT